VKLHGRPCSFTGAPRTRVIAAAVRVLASFPVRMGCDVPGEITTFDLTETFVG